MSIEDNDGNSVIRMSNIWAWWFKACLVMVIPITSTFMGVQGWVLLKVVGHDQSISNLNLRIDYLDRANRSSVSQNVNVGDSKGSPQSARTWLTTGEVAARESVTERTVINWIEHDMIQPPPVKNGKAWQIAEGFRIIPNLAASGDEQ